MKPDGPFAARLLATCLACASLACSASQPSLCTAGEESIFWCDARTKRYEVCASKDLGPATGYMQYRAGARGKAEFLVPAQPRGPTGVFELQLLAKGTVFSFHNGAWMYEIYQPLAGRASIVVTGPGGATLPTIQCSSDSDTLALTSTMRRFEALGIYK